ncbi:MAG: hypothetical protein QOE70_6473 [Chthoniobacter sp.]|jgi:GT2 family glycosyltransferase|nr:hypothetical protein [Chthoniobacter sp.]
MNIGRKPKIVVLGMMTKMPVAGVVWQTVQYLVGFERLGCEVYYVEEHARTPSMFMETEQCDGSARAATFIDQVMRRFDLAGRWAFHALHDDGRYFGMSDTQLRELFASADFIINLHGGTIPLAEHYATGRLVYLETDPVQLQIELHDCLKETIDFVAPHCAFFTFGENLGSPDCGLPVSERFHFRPTRQPVILDFWPVADAPAEVFTSVGNWEQHWRQVQFRGETYTWSKHFEFLKFIDLPSRTSQPMELALASCSDATRELLESHGWVVRQAMDFSMDIDEYRGYVAGSRGEFTAAKDQNVRLRSGWFSDRSATYLASGRPVITQETGFSNVLPTGCGLYGFSTMEDVLNVIETINSNYEENRRAAREIARDYFNYDVVLGRLLDELGVTRPLGRAQLFPSRMIIEPISRRPIRIPEATTSAVLGQPIPAFEPLAELAGPRVSVIVVTYNQLVFTRMCLESVLAASIGHDLELIVVDNASTEATASYLRRLAERNPQVRPLFNSANSGFAAATNQGLAAATGDLLVLLNNDTIVAPGWLEGIAAHLQDLETGILGAVTNRIGNEAEIFTSYRTFGECAAFAVERAREHRGETVEIPRPAMFFLALRRDALEGIGPLDEQFEMGLFEDDDYAMRARAAGYRVVCAEDIFIHHFGEASFGELAPEGDYARLFKANRARFEAKWGVSWAPPQMRPDLAYRQLPAQIAELVRVHLPPDATVLVVSKGDTDLLQIGTRGGQHFPQLDDGTYTGYHPADSREAIQQLEKLRQQGAQYLLFPSTALWWLEHYTQFRQHLESHYELILREENTCVIFELHGARHVDVGATPNRLARCVL